jgi:hypothetical protein
MAARSRTTVKKERQSQPHPVYDRAREQALEEGLLDTFPASDPISVIQPGPAEPNYGRRFSKSPQSGK